MVSGSLSGESKCSPQNGGQRESPLRLQIKLTSKMTSQAAAKETKIGEFPEHIQKNISVTDDGLILLSSVLPEYLPDLKRMGVRPTDTFVVTWPKSGTTWMQFIVAMISLGKDVPGHKSIFQLFNWIENMTHIEGHDNPVGSYKKAENAPSPRFFVSHLQMALLPTEIAEKNPKIIYVARNPKDAAVSYFHFSYMAPDIPNYKDWDEFFEYFYNGQLPCGDWFDQVLSWWKRKDEPNVLFVKFEDMKKTPRDVVVRISRFLERDLSKEEVDDICRESSFEVMKKNPKANPDFTWPPSNKEEIKRTFMRKGYVGGWRNHFTEAQNDRFDRIYQERMKGSGLEFDFN